MTIAALRFPLRSPVSVAVTAPAEIVAAYENGFFKRTPESDGLLIGPPMYEPEGVPDRRGAVIHWFSVEQIVELWNIVDTNKHLPLVKVHLYGLPADWRYVA